ncbi:MAG: FGGY family carbohydrate kinase [Victivallaceae bacterium]|nr:FGGY family carbohydrate kinase [Victivallaceae bacterium]
MKNDGILLGIDFGTGGCKASAVTISGSLLGDVSVEYPTEFAHPGWAEQNCADWYVAMCDALKKLRENGVDFARVIAVAFDGSTHNAVLLDGAMKPVRKTIMWTDQRSTEEAAALSREYGRSIYERAFQMPSPTWTLPQLIWLKKHEPEALARTKHLLFVKDYVRYLVSGVAATDHIEAQGTLFYDMHNKTWAEDLAALAGLRAAMLPELIAPTDRCGNVTAQAAQATGIPEGTPVICGTSDSAAEDYGAGAVEPGDCIIKLATAGNVNVMTDAPHPSEKTLTYSHVIPGMYYSVAATNAAALCQRWFRDAFCEAEKSEAARRKINPFLLLDKLASASSPGAGGVLFHPYLQGERSPYWDAKLRASFTGVSISSTKGDFLRALFEGVAYSLRDCRTVLDEMHLPVKRAFLIGGGARGALWSEIVCGVFNLPLAVPTPGDASFGAALIAGTGIGVFPDAKTAVKQCLRIDKNLVPKQELAAFYAHGFQRYRAIHDALAGVYSNF